jgi:putative DNA primase/helicase
LALRFADLHADKLRYVSLWGKWMIYSDDRWIADDTLLVYNLARRVCRAAAAECGHKKTATAIASAKTVAAIINLARADRRIAATSDQWDSDPWLLNAPGGIVDLLAGKARRSVPNDYMTKICAVGPGGECPLWLKFLDRVTDGDVELQTFLQRVVGYALTGSTREHALFFLYGTGSNGKSVFISTISAILADFQKMAPIETFIASNVERHPTDLAGLRGARLVTAVETEQGRRWAESKIKSLTGGDKIAARFMRQDFFEFIPQFKLLIAGNHKPSLRSVDEAMRRRLHLIPFIVTIPETERDNQLAEKLQQEWSGILQWGIEGCLEWQRNGLSPPAIVRKATNDYLANEDGIAAWIEDECWINSSGWEMTSRLFAAWKAWADRSGEYAGSLKRFREQLAARGFFPHRKAAGTGFDGITLKTVAYSAM